MNRQKNVYFGWGKGSKIVKGKIKDGDKLVDGIFEVPRDNNRDHNGITCVSYEVVPLSGNDWALDVLVSFCAPGDPFSRPKANAKFVVHQHQGLTKRLVINDVPIDYTAEGIRNLLLDRLLKKSVRDKEKVIAGVNVPGWLKKSIKNADLGL